MSRDDVHKNEMPRFQPPAQRAARAQASEDEWPLGDPALAAFAEDLRTIAGGPAPEPRPGLVAAMNQGPLVPIDSSPGRRKMLVKTLVGTLAAKVALGMGVAAASVTAAGAAGVLPDPAQHAVASVVSAATPFDLPDPSAVSLEVSGDTEKPKAKAPVADDSDAGDDKGGTRTLNHGACVSAVAKAKIEPGSQGKTVSSVARSDCGKTDPVASSTTSTTVAGSTTSTTVPGSDQRSANSGRGNTGNNGNGGSGNNGNGGRGNSGNN